MSHIIKLEDGDAPSYWCLSQIVHPAGHWGEKADAVQFARQKDAQDFINIHLRTQAQSCKVAPL